MINENSDTIQYYVNSSCLTDEQKSKGFILVKNKNAITYTQILTIRINENQGRNDVVDKKNFQTTKPYKTKPYKTKPYKTKP